MKKWLQILTWIVPIILIIVSFGFVHKLKEQTIFFSPEINIDYETENKFISEEDILSQIVSISETEILRLNQLNVAAIEEKLNNNNSIKDAQVYKTINGKLIVNIKQRKPIARIFSKKESYYIDDKGVLMPLSKKYSARILVFSGYLNEPYIKWYKFNYTNLNDTLINKTMLDDIYKMANYINKSPFWKAQIEQVIVNKMFEFELVPKVGNHKIVFGEIEGLESKFEKLMVFYKKGLNKTGWNEYSEINLKYKKQVICKKNKD